MCHFVLKKILCTDKIQSVFFWAGLTEGARPACSMSASKQKEKKLMINEIWI